MANGALKAARLALRHVEGIGAQVAFGAPSLLASLVLARWSALVLVSDLTVAFGLASALSTAAWFNLAHALALWGLREEREEDFWCNRIVFSLAAATLTVGLLLTLGIAWRIVLLAVFVKLADAAADLRLGLDLLRETSDRAMRRLLGWSLFRLAAFAGPAALALAAGWEGSRALLLGAGVQLAATLVGHPVPLAAVTRGRLTVAMRLARRTAHFSVAATASGLLVTAPRLVSRALGTGDELGFYAVAFVASTFIGMAFNVVWYRLASATRRDGPLAALQSFAREGTVLALLMAGGLWLVAPVVAWTYGIDDPRFIRIFTLIGCAFVLLSLVQCAANLLKLSQARFLETAAYASAAVTLVAVALTTGRLVLGMVAAGVAMAAVVTVGVQEVRRAAVAR